MAFVRVVHEGGTGREYFDPQGSGASLPAAVQQHPSFGAGVVLRPVPTEHGVTMVAVTQSSVQLPTDVDYVFRPAIGHVQVPKPGMSFFLKQPC